MRSGGEHVDPELAVEVRRGTLGSRACRRGPADEENEEEEKEGGPANKKSI